ncbi:MAG: glucosamine-6-phosphate deaminase [Chroococcales cyanobacterium]
MSILETPLPQPIITKMVNALSVRVYEDAIALAQDTAKIVQDYLESILKEQETATIIFATGNSQLKFLDALSELGGVEWSKIRLFHLDEYLGISANHPASFRCYLRQRVENRVSPKVFHYLEGDALEPIQECDRYTQLLHTQPIDLCFLGIGDNGHLAFNEPSVTYFSDRRSVKIVKLDEITRQQQVNQGHFPTLDAVPDYALTLTIPSICQARKIVCLAPGKAKAKIIRRMLQGEISPSLPASILRQQSHATLFLDQESASLVEFN